MGILASYGAILPKSIIELFPIGILNIHPSLLPKYKGPSPVQTTILNGETQTGVTIIQLDDHVDHGPIIAQETVDLLGNETFQDLTNKLFLRGADMIDKVVRNINTGINLQSKPQRKNSEEFTQKIHREDGKIELSNPPASDVLKRKIRAFYPWPGVHLTVSLGGSERILKLIPNAMVQVEGKKQVSFKDFVNGYGQEAKIILEKLSLWQ